MGLFVRLLPYNHADALEKLILWSYLNHLPTFSCMGVSLFRLHRVKIPEPKQTPGEDGSLCVVSCTEWAGTLKSSIFLCAIKQGPYVPSNSNCSMGEMLFLSV